MIAVKVLTGLLGVGVALLTLELLAAYWRAWAVEQAVDLPE